MWPVGNARRGVHVGGRMFALQQMVCQCMCVFLRTCAYASAVFMNKLQHLKFLKQNYESKDTTMAARCEEGKA